MSVLNSKMKLLNKLMTVGFSVYEAKIIDCLLTYEEPTAKDIAQVSEVPKNKVYEIIEKLQNDSVVEALLTKPKRFRLLNLQKYIEHRETTRQQEHQVALAVISEADQKRSQRNDSDREVWTTEGSRALIAKVNDVLHETQQESIAFIDVWIEGSENYRHIQEAIARGVKFYFLGPATKESLPIIKAYQAAGVEVRAYPVESAGYSIFDTRMVQVRVSSHKIISLWINNKYLAGILREHFFQHWKKAKKIT